MEINFNYTMKSFKSLIKLDYRDNKLEMSYRNTNYNLSKINGKIFSKILLIMSIVISIFEGILVIFDKKNSLNLLWNFYFCILNTVICLLLHIIFRKFVDKMKTNNCLYYTCLLGLHVSFGNIFLSATSISIVYFQNGIELVSVLFVMKIVLSFTICLFIFRKFTVSLTILLINLFFNFVLLLKIHVIKAVLYYLFSDTVFNMIVLVFIYMCELLSKSYFQTLLKLQKEKKYFIETLDFFNISYFVYKNNEIKNATKMEEILKMSTLNYKEKKNKLHQVSQIKLIENALNELIFFENLPQEVEEYFLSLKKNKKNFKFKNLISCIEGSEETFQIFKRFTNIGILKLKNSSKEELYYQFYLKLKICEKKSMIPTSLSQDNIENYISNKVQIKIEGIFKDITQNYLKKETQLNSLILAKHIHDIKSPLFLLEQVVTKYQKLIKDKINYDQNESKDHNEIAYNTTSFKTKENTIYKIYKQSKYIKTIATNIFEIIHSINDFTKRQNNINEIQNSARSKWEKVNIRKLIQSCVNFFIISKKFNMNKKNIRIYCEIEDLVPKYVTTLKMILKQTIMNLMSNSMKFTHNGEIKVVCKLDTKFELEEKNYLEILVIDTGVGIIEENIVKLCRPFCLTTGNYNGSGLGLSIVKDFLNSLESKLDISSVKNRGSVFSFKLLLKEENLRDYEPSYTSSSDEDSITEKTLGIDAKCFSRPINKFSTSSIIQINNTIESDIDAEQVNFLKKKTNKSMSTISSKMNISYDSDNSTRTLIYKKPLTRIPLTQPNGIFSKGNNNSFSYFEKFTKLSLDDTYNLNLSSNKHDQFVLNKHNILENMNHHLIPCKIHPIKYSLSNYSFFNSHSPELNIEFYSIQNTEDCFETTKKSTFVKSKQDLLNFGRSLHKSLNFLIIDDDSNFQKQISYLIMGLTKELNAVINCQFASDPYEGINKIYSNYKELNLMFDVIFIDENMPFMKGSNFTKLFKTVLAHEGLYNTNIVSMNGDTCAEINKLQRIPYDYFIEKPCSKNEIYQILFDILNYKL